MNDKAMKFLIMFFYYILIELLLWMFVFREKFKYMNLRVNCIEKKYIKVITNFKINISINAENQLICIRLY